MCVRSTLPFKLVEQGNSKSTEVNGEDLGLEQPADADADAITSQQFDFSTDVAS